MYMQQRNDILNSYTVTVNASHNLLSQIDYVIVVSQPSGCVVASASKHPWGVLYS